MTRSFQELHDFQIYAIHLQHHGFIGANWMAHIKINGVETWATRQGGVRIWAFSTRPTFGPEDLAHIARELDKRLESELEGSKP